MVSDTKEWLFANRLLGVSSVVASSFNSLDYVRPGISTNLYDYWPVSGQIFTINSCLVNFSFKDMTGRDDHSTGQEDVPTAPVLWMHPSVFIANPPTAVVSFVPRSLSNNPPAALPAERFFSPRCRLRKAFKSRSTLEYGASVFEKRRKHSLLQHHYHQQQRQQRRDPKDPS